MVLKSANYTNRFRISRKDEVLGKKKNETKILYLALLLVLLHLHVLNIGFLSHFSFFPKPCSLPFYTTLASNSYIPPTFSLENVFLYL